MDRNILIELSTLQQQAYDKCIDFKLDLYFNPNKMPVANVFLYYAVAGDLTETHTFTTTFSDNKAQNTIRLNKVKNFIQTATLNSEV